LMEAAPAPAPAMVDRADAAVVVASRDSIFLVDNEAQTGRLGAAHDEGRNADWMALGGRDRAPHRLMCEDKRRPRLQRPRELSLSLCQACRVASRRLWFVRRERGLEEQDVVVLVFCCCADVLSGTSQIFPGNPWEAMTTWHVAGGAGQVGTLEAPSAESTHCHPFLRRTHCFYGSLTSLRCSNIQMELSCKGSHQTTTFYPQYSRLINTYPFFSRATSPSHRQPLPLRSRTSACKNTSPRNHQSSLFC
jgi:hypothetical protein